MIFGGKDPSGKYFNDIYILNLEDLHWSCPFIAGYQPASRYNHGACLIRSKVQEPTVMILGNI